MVYRITIKAEHVDVYEVPADTEKEAIIALNEYLSEETFWVIYVARFKKRELPSIKHIMTLERQMIMYYEEEEEDYEETPTDDEYPDHHYEEYSWPPIEKVE